MKQLASGRYTLGVQVVQRRVRRLAEHVRAQLVDRDEAPRCLRNRPAAFGGHAPFTPLRDSHWFQTQSLGELFLSPNHPDCAI